MTTRPAPANWSLCSNVLQNPLLQIVMHIAIPACSGALSTEILSRTEARKDMHKVYFLRWIWLFYSKKWKVSPRCLLLQFACKGFTPHHQGITIIAETTVLSQLVPGMQRKHHRVLICSSSSLKMLPLSQRFEKQKKERKKKKG